MYTLTKKNQKPYFLNNFYGDLFPELSSFFKESEGNIETQNVPLANIKESEKEFTIELAIPGVNKKDISVELSEDKLHISAKTSSKKEEKKENEYALQEFTSKSYKRIFRLPENKFSQEHIAADYADGVLTVSIPKTEKENIKKSITIK